MFFHPLCDKKLQLQQAEGLQGNIFLLYHNISESEIKPPAAQADHSTCGLRVSLKCSNEPIIKNQNVRKGREGC